MIAFGVFVVVLFVAAVWIANRVGFASGWDACEASGCEACGDDERRSR